MTLNKALLGTRHKWRVPRTLTFEKKNERGWTTVAGWTDGDAETIWNMNGNSHENGFEQWVAGYVAQGAPSLNPDVGAVRY